MLITQALSKLFRKISQKNSLAFRWGYDVQMSALRARSKRCAKAWASHLESCHQCLSTSLQKQLEKNSEEKLKSVLLIGSGLLLETPIELILKYSDKIFLADLYHSEEAKAAAKKFPQRVFLTNLDATAALSSLQRGMNFEQVQSALEKVKPETITSFWPKADFVISANVLSQLPLNLVERMKASEEEREQIRQQIRQQHLEFLKAYGADVLLFSDFVVQYFSSEAKQISQAGFELDLKDFEHVASWDWNIAPIPEYDKNTSVILKMLAYEHLKQRN